MVKDTSRQAVTKIFSASGIVLLSLMPQADFLTEQKRFQRVRTAISEKQSFLAQKLGEHQLSFTNLNLLMVAYKEHDVLEIFGKQKEDRNYRKILSYQICARSGGPGPKRRQGDGQVPEGFYYIDRFNPTSTFYLSLGINYPNLADRRKSNAADPGGDIFIHGSCVTIGCLPMTDTSIREIYLLAVHARNNGQVRIPVYIFPFRMTGEYMATYKARYKDDQVLTAFWDNLKTGYDRFSADKLELRFSVSPAGEYVFEK